jgi:endonuclease-3 related protein
MIECSLDLLVLLKQKGFDRFSDDPYWWPNSGTFEVLVGAILTQNTKWERVEESLQTLREHNVLDLNSLASIPRGTLEKLIKRSGFYKTKAKYIQTLCQAVQKEFGDFETFCETVDRPWLLSQKGIGEESCDAILNYGCKREVFVVDKYTQKLLAKIGYEFDAYEEIQNWMQKGLKGWEKIYPDFELARVYALFHGMIVQAVKTDKTYGFLHD